MFGRRILLFIGLAVAAAGIAFVTSVLIVMSQNPGTVQGSLVVYGP